VKSKEKRRGGSDNEMDIISEVRRKSEENHFHDEEENGERDSSDK